MKLKIVVEIDKRSASVEIGVDTMSQIIGRIPCNKDTQDFFKMLAEIQSEKLQENIAANDHMFIDILKSLSMKDHPNVLRNLVRNENAKKFITTDQAINCISDNYTIESIISALDQFEEIDSDTLIKKLITNSNPDIRQMIAESYNIPKKYKKMLLKDNDPDVRNAAFKSVND